VDWKTIKLVLQGIEAVDHVGTLRIHLAASREKIAELVWFTNRS
jgi:hypothetical protein